MHGAGSLVSFLAAASLVGYRHGSGAVGALETTPLPAETCESKTINYITHTLPQQCLRTSWSTANSTVHTAATEPAASPTAQAAAAAGSNETQPGQQQQQQQQQQKAADGAKDGEGKEGGGDAGGDNQDLDTNSFISFEEWKALQLKKSGQDPADLQARKRHDQRGAEAHPGSSDHLDSVGDENEIALDFDVLSEKVSELAGSTGPAADVPRSGEARTEAVLYDDGKTQYYRSKDAGKTCKERFSHSSFDAGATVLKTNKGAKNAKAILVENKDSYMLLECGAQNKYVIVELSDDILVDTVVLANFEFFSSMIRKFRVSVSDRYPVKTEKWKDLGTFEARNSRDIQPFLIEHPQIWAKYIRIEFLSHYGNEFYCPISLLRVHGTRMLDSWKESEAGPDDDDDAAAIEPPSAEQPSEPPEAAASETVQASNVSTATEAAAEYVSEVGLSPWHPFFYYDTESALGFCPAVPSVAAEPTSASASPGSGQAVTADTGADAAPGTVAPPSAMSETGESAQPSPQLPSASHSESPPPPSAPAAPSSAGLGSPPDSPGNSSTATEPAQPLSQPGPAPRASSASEPAPARQAAPASNKPSAGRSAATTVAPKPLTVSAQTKNRTSSTGQPVASPTVQESFFKSVTKRLQLLESNTSLSLQYIEDQSRFLQDALLRMERKQISRVDSFLDSLNKTVLSELRNVRTQYDQIWQSTVIALETQREQSQREIVALSERLGLLADEVVFQKRMAILQALLLLACLVLVIFSRGLIGSPVFAAAAAGFEPASLLSSPSSAPRSHLHHHAAPYGPDSSPLQRRAAARGQSHPDKVLPLTPTSDYGRGATPPPPPLDPRSAYFDEMDGYNTPARKPRSKLSSNLRDLSDGSADENGKPDDDVDDDGIVASESNVIEAAEPPPLLARSSLAQMGSARKPLPALPEDPT